ncbi:MAG: hypothetical protein LBV26_02635 [Bacteroidales bacterium]|jgi:hypothetical protein|nr:hypothetical protein [Bacteroidales bacterium]
MKRYKNIFLAVALGILAVSCESYDEYWVDTELDFETEIDVRASGRFNQIIRVDETYINDYSPARERLLDINLISSWIQISNLTRYDRVTLSIIANDDMVYDFRGVISGNHENMFYIEDDGYYDLMLYAMDIIKTRGYVDLEIIGTSNISDGGPLVFTFKNAIDAYMRD